MEITIPKYNQNNLIEIELVPSAYLTDTLKNIFDKTSDEIKTVLWKKNKVAIGEPFCEDIPYKSDQFLSKVIPNGRNWNEFCFKLVSLCCSFRPDRKCRFSWGRISLDLLWFNNKTSSSDATNITEDLIFLDLYPKEILSPATIKSNYNFGPELKLTSLEVKLGSIGIEEDFIKYSPRIFSFGNRTSSISWDFKPTKSFEMPYNVDYLLALIRVPRNGVSVAKLKVSAEIEVFLGKWIPILVTTKEEAAIKDFTIHVTG